MAQTIEDKLNVLRAGVLGANDGIISTAGLVIGVASASDDPLTILIAGLAGLLAGALSMAGGEYSSVSTQQDVEKAEVEKEARLLSDDFLTEQKDLEQYYIEQGLSAQLSKQVAQELMTQDALKIKMKAKFNITLGEYVSPWKAALSSVFAFSCGACLPLISIMVLPKNWKIIGTFVVVSIALALTGYISAALGGAPRMKAMVRNLLVGTLTMLVTYGIGQWIKL